MRLQSIAALAIMVAVAVPLSASARVTYTYTGNTFDTFVDDTPPSGSYDSSMRVTVSFTVDAPLAPNIFFPDILHSAQDVMLSDGRTTLTIQNVEFFNASQVGTDSQGEIIDWVFDLGNFIRPVQGAQAAQITTCSSNVCEDVGILVECLADSGGGFCEQADIQVDEGSVTSSPGTWTMTAIPVPSSSWGGQLSIVAFLIATGFMALRAAQREGEAAG
jgi:hypothetical protein